MAKISYGLLGGFIGRAGPVTGFIRNGQPLIRISRNSGIPENTPARIAQRDKIRICNEFTKAFSGTGFFNKTFPACGHTGTGYNRATSAIMNLAIAGKYPNLRIFFPMVLISKGLLPKAEEVHGAPDQEGNILFSWKNHSFTGTAKNSDRVILAAFFPELKQAVFQIGESVRADGHARLDTKNFKGHTAETWLGFLNEQETEASDSVYGGRIIL